MCRTSYRNLFTDFLKNPSRYFSTYFLRNSSGILSKNCFSIFSPTLLGIHSESSPNFFSQKFRRMLFYNITQILIHLMNFHRKFLFDLPGYQLDSFRYSFRESFESSFKKFYNNPTIDFFENSFRNSFAECIRNSFRNTSLQSCGPGNFW